MVGMTQKAAVEWSLLVATVPAFTSKKKAGAVEHPEVFDRAGLLVNEPPGYGWVALQSVIRRLQLRLVVE
jgi:hypothetical protein